MWEIQLELMEEEESENLSEHCPHVQKNFSNLVVGDS
jgi:hypothetical protein